MGPLYVHESQCLELLYISLYTVIKFFEDMSWLHVLHLSRTKLYSHQQLLDAYKAKMLLVYSVTISYMKHANCKRLISGMSNTSCISVPFIPEVKSVSIVFDRTPT